jgi:hypothetical protein
MIPAATPVAAKSAATPCFLTRTTVPSPRRISAIDPSKIPPLKHISGVPHEPGGGHQAQRGVHAPILGASEAAIIAARISSSSTAVYGSTGVSTARFWVRIHGRL